MQMGMATPVRTPPPRQRPNRVRSTRWDVFPSPGGKVAERRSSSEPRVSSRLNVDSRLTAEEIAKTISEVKEAAAEAQARLSNPLPEVVSWRRRPATAVMFVLLAAAVWGTQLIVWKPSVPTMSDRDRDARLRYTVALQAVRVEHFRENTHRLPTSLGEVSEAFQGMTYVLLDSAHYRITGTDEHLVLSYRSDSPLQVFVGGSMLSIREKRKQ